MPSWETSTTTTPTGYTFRSDPFRQVAAEGKTEGEARAVPAVLEARGLAAPESVRDRQPNLTGPDPPSQVGPGEVSPVRR
jgi:hypothetical protein